MSVNSEATNAALAAASESIVTAAVVVYTPTPPPTSAPVQTPAPTASSSSTTSDEFISRTNFLYFAGVFGGIFLMMCMVIHKQRSMLATLNPKSNQGSSMGFFKKKAVDGLSEREHQALKEAFATDAKAGDLSGHALAATTVNGLLRLGGLERFQGALAEIGIDDTEFFFDGHTLNDSTLMRIVGMNRGEVERLREVIANAEKPSDTLETVFNMVDLDGNGDLSKDEMIAAADKLNMTADQAAKLFEALDEDGSGHISKNEFSKNFRFSISGLARDGVSLPGPSMPQMSVSGMSLPPFSEMSPMAGISLSSMPSIASMPQTSISGVFASLTGGASSDESIDKKSGLNPLSTLNTKGPSTSL